MNKEMFIHSVFAYKSTMVQARKMLNCGIISEEEYLKIDTIMTEKYGLSSCSIYRDNDLIYIGSDGNMSRRRRWYNAENS